ncbi:protein Tos6p [[Candida] railenensis]|uniref:Protein Tos6p n=1 Tax=[Candida] railenensis TaxID=45579 RepID=A0A9P0QVE9_9ASCO|nr:protein Tos6p [[Candida] railenensis]
MQFSTVAILASAAFVSAATVTETDSSSTLVTITSCGSEVTDCPADSTVAAVASSSVAANSTLANVTTAEAGANKQFAAAGVAALAAGALLAL